MRTEEDVSEVYQHQIESLEEKISILETALSDLQAVFTPTIKVKFVDDEAKSLGLPHHRKAGDAGVDLHVILSPEDRDNGLTIFPGERKLLDTGMHMEFPHGVFARISHRSSTERRRRLRVVEGTIDQGFRGRLFTQVSNDNTFPIVVEHGERLAQMILSPIVHGYFSEVTELADSDRGEAGFGSTGR